MARRRKSKSKGLHLNIAALLAASIVLGTAGWLLIVYPKQKNEGPPTETYVELRPTEGVGPLALRLEQAGLIDSALTWSAYMRVLGASARLRSGTVALRGDLTPVEVARHVATGMGWALVRVTIPEGFTRRQIAERLESRGVCSADAFLAITEDPRFLEHHHISGESFEGYLFPDTYQFVVNETARRVLIKMITAWRRRVLPALDEGSAALGRYRSSLGWGVHEVITLASVVEKEAARRDEQPIIAGVFLNRLLDGAFRPRRLQADPTVSYGCLSGHGRSEACAAYDGRRITRAMLQDRSNPYNTYRHDGLPPGPISNPGLGAVRAVLNPANHEFFYFVASGGGRHQFSRTLDEHLEAVSEYRNQRRSSDGSE